MSSASLDITDKHICELLQRNARLSISEISSTVGLSVPATRERVHKLEQRGVISGFYASVSPQFLGLDIAAFIFVTVEGSHNHPSFTQQCKLHPDIIDCHAITGKASHILKIRTENTASLERLLAEVQQWEGVVGTTTNLVLSTHVENKGLQIMRPELLVS